MNSDSHDYLPFHPRCPICRQTRLTGAVPDDGLVSPRTQAVLAAGVLAVSTTSPVTAAFAAEQDQQLEGGAPVAQSGTPDPANSPDFDPGGDATDLPPLAPPVPQAETPADPGNDDTAAVDQAPATNPDDPIVDSGDGTDATPAGSQTDAAPVAPPATTPAPPAVPTHGSAPASPIATAPPAPAAGATPSGPAPRAVHRATHHTRAVHSPHHQPKRVAETNGQARPLAAVGAATPTPAPTAAVAHVARSGITHFADRRAEPGDRTHTVLAGESLWMIASALLGRDASTAQVAREVHRLWELNDDLIGTGNPDLLMVGTKLVLR